MAGGWFDWFSDWGTSAWAEDVEAAADQAEAWTEQVAAAKGWPTSDTSNAMEKIEIAGSSSDNAQNFWTKLAADWGASTSADGWSDLGNTFASAAGTATTTAESRDQGSVATVIGGTFTESASDIGESASWVKTHGHKVAIGVLVVGVLGYAVSR